MNSDRDRPLQETLWKGGEPQGEGDRAATGYVESGVRGQSGSRSPRRTSSSRKPCPVEAAPRGPVVVSRGGADPALGGWPPDEGEGDEREPTSEEALMAELLQALAILTRRIQAEHERCARLTAEVARLDDVIDEQGERLDQVVSELHRSRRGDTER